MPKPITIRVLLQCAPVIELADTVVCCKDIREDEDDDDKSTRYGVGGSSAQSGGGRWPHKPGGAKSDVVWLASDQQVMGWGKEHWEAAKKDGVAADDFGPQGVRSPRHPLVRSVVLAGRTITGSASLSEKMASPSMMVLCAPAKARRTSYSSRASTKRGAAFVAA
jgi:hypothetical protein